MTWPLMICCTVHTSFSGWNNFFKSHSSVVQRLPLSICCCFNLTILLSHDALKSRCNWVGHKIVPPQSIDTYSITWIGVFLTMTLAPWELVRLVNTQLSQRYDVKLLIWRQINCEQFADGCLGLLMRTFIFIYF